MYRKIKYNFIFLLLFPLCATAQLEADNWVFSHHAKYVNFNKATQPIAVNYPPNAFQPLTGTTTYSDKNGQLLFYSDGNFLYNRDFSISPSTTNSYILSGTVFGNFSQQVLAIPYPDHDSLYILFHIFHGFNNNYKPELLYSIINMNMDSGKGGVDLIQRNIPLFSGNNVLFKLSAILHCNKKDIWVVGHLANSDKYFSLLVTANGVSNAPVYSTGSYIPVPLVPDSALHSNLDGSIKVSPLGNKIAAAFKGLNYIELSDFNTQTGIVSGIKKIVAAPPPADTVYHNNSRFAYGPRGVEFSPTGDRLYTTSNYEVTQIGNNTPHHTSFVYQFDVSLPTEAQIQSSRYFLDSVFNFEGGAIQLANNGKLYVNIYDHLCEIANPENLGAACNYTRFTVLSGGQGPGLGLPIFLQSYLRYPIIATGNCQFQNIDFNIQNPVGISSVSWDFGDPASGVNNTSTSFTPTHIYTTQGIYKVKAVLQNANGCSADTINKIISAGPFKVYLGADTALCQGDTLQLKMNIPYASNHWSNSSVDTVIKITQSGTYWVRVNLGDCFTTDTIVVSFNNLPQFTLGNDTVICNSTSVTLSPNPVYSNVSYLWNTNSNTSSILTNAAGDYWLRVMDNNGCKWRDTIKISFKTLPGFNLGIDTSICENDSLLLNATVSGANSYLWNNGVTLPMIKAFQQNIYWCDVSKDGCTFRDSLTLTVKPLPMANLGNDVALCEDNTLLLVVTNSNSSYLWQDASTSPTYLVKQKGQYRVRVTMNGCISRDTVNIEYNLKPKFTLGADSRLCLGSKIILNPQITGVSYLWQDGSTNPTYTVTQPGLYSLTATNNCGPTTDDIIIGNGICNLYVPNSFTPNSDGKNDLFKANYGDNVTEFHLQVFNRYGQIVFDTKDKNKGWDGNFAGNKQPFGTYVWLIQYKTTTDNSVQKLQGSVLLIH